MIKQIFNVKHYWKVVVYYNVNYDLFDYIISDLNSVIISRKTLNNIYHNMSTRRAKAVTVSNIKEHISVVLFNYHENYYAYIRFYY